VPVTGIERESERGKGGWGGGGGEREREKEDIRPTAVGANRLQGVQGCLSRVSAPGPPAVPHEWPTTAADRSGKGYKAVRVPAGRSPPPPASPGDTLQRPLAAADRSHGAVARGALVQGGLSRVTAPGPPTVRLGVSAGRSTPPPAMPRGGASLTARPATGMRDAPRERRAAGYRRR
jgi:hypothetical protein